MRWPWFVLVFVLALLAHAATLQNGFVFDDKSALLENPLLRGNLDLGAIFGADFWGRPPGEGPGTWRPLVVFTFWVDLKSHGAPWAMHANNVVWHAVASVLFALGLFRHTRRLLLSILAGAIFAALAVNTEAVAALVGRADVMAVAFSMLALWQMPAHDEPRRSWRYALVFASMLGALLCKESALVAPLWLLAAEVVFGWPLRRRERLARALCLSAAAALAVLVYFLLRTALFASAAEVLATHNNNPLIGEPFGPRLFTSARLFALAAERIVLPLQLAPDYSFAEILPSTSFAEPEVLVGFALVLLLAAVAWLSRRRSPVATLGIAIVLVSFAAMSHVVVPLPTIFAERLLYACAAGFALALAAALEALAVRRSRLLALSLAALLVGGNLVRGVSRDLDWKDDLTLFSQAVRDTPRCARAWTNLGAALRTQQRLEEAKRALETAMSIAPRWSSPRTLLGTTFDELRRPAEAEPLMRSAVALDPRDRAAAFNFALFLGRRGRPAEGASVLRAHHALRPGDARAVSLQDQLERDAARRR